MRQDLYRWHIHAVTFSFDTHRRPSMTRTLLLLPVLLLAIPAIATAQVRIGPNGIRSGDTTIDARGVHTAGADVTAAGVQARRDGGTTILSNGQNRSIDCHGGRLTVNGNRNRLTVANCTAVTIAGNGNTVAARFAAPGSISIPGNRNQVTWQARAGIRVGVSAMGTANAIVRR